MVLFRCTTFFHLINIINIKLNMLKNEEAELILTADTDFGDIPGKLNSLGLFKRIICLETSDTKLRREFRGKSKEEQIHICMNPDVYLEKVDLQSNYSDLYFGFADDCNKLFYYYLVNKKINPKIHLFDEGMASYALGKIPDSLPHERLGNLSFYNNICELLLYEPAIYSGPKLQWPINQLPKINCNESMISGIYNSLFYKNELPSEKYIFFESGVFQDRSTTQDMDILDYISSIVGKENIIVKQHSRTKDDRFTPRGYKVMEKGNVPWEITALSCDISDKVLLSYISTASLSPRLIFNKRLTAIHLFKLMPLEKSLYTTQKDFLKSYIKLLEVFNSDNRTVYNPDSFEELKEILFYLERKMKIDKK